MAQYDIFSLFLFSELPNLLNVLDIVEALMCVGNGNKLVCQLVANNPESFLEGKLLKV